MAPRIPEHVVDDVRQRTDIVDIISEFVPLKKRGKNFFGLCPFHQERAPSFSVNQEKQIFHCFGCGKGGNVFTFLMEYEKLSFWEALKYLAQRAHITLPTKDADTKQQAENDSLFYANQFAATYYHKILLETKVGAKALQYLKNRGFSKETLETFLLGYAPPGWENVLTVGRKKSITPEVFRKAGLVILREKGEGYYDRFRDRIIFPIINLTGKVVAFGGRILAENEELPKYINSPETPIYNKGKILYGLFQAKNRLREADRTVVVEGYTDLISLFQAGIENVVASSGTAFTSDHARLISRYTKNVMLLFDADAAGADATLRGIETLLENGLDVDIVSLPAGSDPDSFVREQGKEGLVDLFEKADTFVDFIVNKTADSQDMSTVKGKAQAVETIVPVLAKIRDEVKRSLWIKKVSEHLSVDEDVLLRSVGRVRRPRTAASEPVQVDIRTSSTKAAEEQTEYGLLRLMLTDPLLLRRTMEDVTPDDFQCPEAKEIAEVLFQYGEGDQHPDSASIIDRLTRPEAKRLVSLLSMEESAAENRETLFEDYIRYIKQGRIAEELVQVREALKKAQQDGREEEVIKLMARFQELSQLKQRIKRHAPQNGEHV
jgi:DNA primase